MTSTREGRGASPKGAVKARRPLGGVRQAVPRVKRADPAQPSLVRVWVAPFQFFPRISGDPEDPMRSVEGMGRDVSRRERTGTLADADFVVLGVRNRPSFRAG